uniref:Uncharacterized protein n=1 Tax=Anguilla anguilla TaxID=7936 RepID=A0A0E9RUW1_ANGAN
MLIQSDVLLLSTVPSSQLLAPFQHSKQSVLL